jgi:serine/threonine protein kinase
MYTSALQMVKALEHLHSHNVIHGDLKPLNIVRSQGYLKLIDLDAAVKYTTEEDSRATQGQGESIGMKYSTAYLPPEMILKAYNHELSRSEYVIRQPVSPESDELALLSRIMKKGERSSYTIMEHQQRMKALKASPAYDMWSLGCILYHLFTNEPLWRANGEDNIDQEQLELLYHWGSNGSGNGSGRGSGSGSGSGAVMIDVQWKRLSKVIHPLQRNLLSLLLHPHPSKRFKTMSHVLAHPYFSKQKTGRLLGEGNNNNNNNASYDIFLSYRVDSDAFLTSLFYEELSQRGINVWWDQKCLKNGLNWEEGFCDGLVNSAVFIPLLSKQAIKERFETLQETSYCDNVLLEHRLALELQVTRSYCVNL